MSKIYVLFLVLICVSPGFSQIVFEPGSFIDNSGKEVSCLIRNRDWKYNPAGFEYKLDSTGSVSTKSIEDVIGFNIGNLVFVRAMVEIDMSGSGIDGISTQKAPEWNQDTLFLRVLVQGDANLYYYENPKLKRFFYNLKSDPIRQLIFKKYVTSDGKIMVNKTYMGQLNAEVRCDSQSPEKTKFTRKDLESYFVEFNQCKGVAVKTFAVKKKAQFYIKPTIGVNYADLTVKNGIAHIDAAFDSRISPRIGVELEYILPYNKGAWSLFIDPGYRQYRADGSTEHEIPRFRAFKAEYSSIEVPIGVRRYFFLPKKKDSKFFVDGFINAIDLMSSGSVESDFGKLNTKARPNYGAGVGFAYKKASIDLRYYTPRTILGDYIHYTSKLNIISLIAGYRIP